MLAMFAASLVVPAASTLSHAPPSIALYEKPDREALSLLVQGTDDFNPSALEALSNFGMVTTVAGRVAVLHTQGIDVEKLVQLPFISRIQRSWPLTVNLDKSVPDIGANTVWSEVRDPTGRNVTGLGVVIGFVDTGIDVSHPDFTFPNGSTKILYVWDQTLSGRPPVGFSYGYECNSGDIEAGGCRERDTFGHGTHVAGIAAGSGRANGNYIGVAPGASIIFVKSGHEVCGGSNWTFDSAQILDGINYIAKKAAQLGKRAVINLSLGGNIGGHDGSDPWEIALDQFVKQGTAVAVSAGNEAQEKSHIRGQLAQGANVTFSISVKESTTDLAIDVWYSPQDEMAATLRTPNGRTYVIPTATGAKTANYGNVTAFANTGDFGKELYFEVNSAGQLPKDGWTVTLSPRQISSNGVWDAWVDTVTCAFPGAAFLSGAGYQIDQNITIGIPGTAHHVVTVGAYATKTAWEANGHVFGSIDAKTGGIATFSSLGPTRDGRTKPDIVAPGMFIVSARSNSTAKGDSDPDPFHRVLAGTSMAAPHAAGVIALMFQYAPDLPATELITILQQTARLDMNTDLLTAGSPVWGFGKLDARTATGLFRLTLVPNGVPSNTQVPVTIDDSEKLTVPSSSWLDLYFPRGTTHTVSFGTTVQRGSAEQYQLTEGEFIEASGVYRLTKYTAEELTHPVTVNQTGYLLVNYVQITTQTTQTSVTQNPPPPLDIPLVGFLLIGIAFLMLVSLAYRRRRKKHEEG